MSALPHSTSPHPASGPVQPVLLVDDDPVSRSVSEALFAGAGYQVASESRGDAVLRLVRTMYMRLVVIELYIPCSEGPCVATILRDERARFPRLRVIIVTRHKASAHLRWALDARADVLVAKSSSARMLLREVRRLDDSNATLPASAYPAIGLLPS